jgi:hypothetical protein
MKISLKHKALALAMVGAIGGAQTTVLAINAPTLDVESVGSAFGGTLLAKAITLVSNTSYNGTARAAVYDTGTGLDFYYQFTNNDTSKNGVERFTGYDFSSLGTSAVNVFQTSAAFGDFLVGTEKSDYADRTAMGVIGISFVPNGMSKINPGTTSFTQIVRTNARNYIEGIHGAPLMANTLPSGRTALIAGAQRLGVVSSMRANAKSRMFYIRIKDEVEEALKQLRFAQRVLEQPCEGRGRGADCSSRA